jgi:hypothetical protein
VGSPRPPHAGEGGFPWREPDRCGDPDAPGDPDPVGPRRPRRDAGPRRGAVAVRDLSGGLLRHPCRPVQGPGRGADPDGLKAHRTRTIGGATWDLKLIQTEVAAGADQAPFPKRLRICLISTTAPTSGLQAATRDLLGGTAGQESSHGLGWAYFDGAPRRYITGALTPAETNAGLAKDPLDIIVANETDAGAAIAITDVRKAGK